jgi:hypothetical protein
MYTDLDAVLNTANPLTGNQIDCLEVTGWDSMSWMQFDTIGLIHLCSARKVKHLYFLSGQHEFIRKLHMLSKLNAGCNLPFLHDLERISFVASDRHHHDLGRLFEQSNVKKISLHPRIRREDYIVRFLYDLGDSKAFDRNYSILKIDYIDEGGPVDFQDAIPKLKHLEDIFERNQNCRKRCQTAVMIFIGKVFLRKDISVLVAKMVWGTRGMPVWKPEE